MKKTLTFAILLFTFCIFLAACGDKCDHTYDNACDATCNDCGETREVGAHDFADADCDTAKTCKTCGATEGSALGHEWTTPDVDLCEVQSTCSRCGATDGENKEHAPAEDDGDCTTEVKCTVCGDVTTPAGQHTPNDDDGNCLTAINCSVCGTTTTPAKESHTGGTATCTEKAVCAVCNTAYGELDPTNHRDTETKIRYADENTHETYYECCNTVVETGTHNGEATCSSYGYCTICAMGYAEPDPTNHKSDETYTIGIDGEKHGVYYSCCQTLKEEVEHTVDRAATCNQRASCADCGNEFGEFNPENHAIPEARFNYIDGEYHEERYICCNTVAKTEPHNGEASCMHVAYCTVCKQNYGNYDMTNHESDEFIYESAGPGAHTKLHACCRTVSVLTESCSGGTATCVAQAVCTICGNGYGELAPENHDFGSGNTCICGAKIAFTGIVVDDEISDEYRYDETSKTYTIIIPADEVGGTGYLSCDIIGTNLTLIEDTNTLLKVQHEDESGPYLPPDGLLEDMLQNYGYFGWSVSYGDGEWEKLSYSNDGGMTWTTYTFEVKQAYSITVNASQNGTVTANEYAIEGDNIALNVSPAEGYMLDTLSVTDASGNTIVVENNQFTMPASAVTVNATFAVCDHKDSRHETATDNDDGTHSFTCTVCGVTGTENHTFGADNTCICGVVKLTVEQVSMTDIDSPFGDGWHNEIDLRVIGTQAEGKTAWENGDQIIVTFTSPRFGIQYGTLTYDGSWSTDVSFSYLENETPTVSAIYAPCYEVVDGNMQLKDGMQLGMTEYISAACSITDGTLNISFEGVTRNYSRLRISTLPGQTLTVNTTGFTPAGANEAAVEAYTLTADENGNIYLYGTFAVGATVSVKQGEVTLEEYTFTAEKHPEGAKPGINYALDAMPVIDGTLGGKTEATEDDINALVEQLKVYVDNGITTIIVTGEEPAMIDVGSWINTAIGEAIYRLSKEDSYNGKIDLILPDVTEIFDQEFDGAHALNSITLPKVTTVGDGAFYDCQYLEELTFGSVVTAINHKTRAEFHRVGEKVGGCNLVLNAEQANAATEYQPNVETKTWWNTEWQSITLK